MSARRPRTPEHWPKMKHRAAGRLAKSPAAQARVMRDFMTLGSEILDATMQALAQITTEVVEALAAAFSFGNPGWQNDWMARVDDAIAYARRILGWDDVDELVRQAGHLAAAKHTDLATEIRTYADDIREYQYGPAVRIQWQSPRDGLWHESRYVRREGDGPDRLVVVDHDDPEHPDQLITLTREQAHVAGCSSCGYSGAHHDECTDSHRPCGHHHRTGLTYCDWCDQELGDAR